MIALKVVLDLNKAKPGNKERLAIRAEGVEGVGGGPADVAGGNNRRQT
jgi:hypothetical protein